MRCTTSPLFGNHDTPGPPAGLTCQCLARPPAPLRWRCQTPGSRCNPCQRPQRALPKAAALPAAGCKAAADGVPHPSEQTVQALVHPQAAAGQAVRSGRVCSRADNEGPCSERRRPPVRGTRPPSATRGPLILTNADPHAASARKVPTANHQPAAQRVQRLCGCTRSQPVARGTSTWSA